MRIDPAIGALRRDRGLQRRAQAATVAACDAWRATPQASRVLADFGRYGDGASVECCPDLLALFDGQEAFGLMTALLRELCAALADKPFGHPPFRHGYDRGTATLLLARRGRAQLVLHACEPGRRSFDVVSFSDGERRETVLAGEATGRVVRRHRRYGWFAEQRLALEPGVCLALDLGDEAVQLLEIERRLVSLRLHRSARHPEPSREYDLASGALLRQAAGDIRDSRREAMIALLGRLGRAEAVPIIAAIAREPGDTSLRWQALRECLALDSGAGFAALCDLARADGDPLAHPATVLRAQLIEEHPEFGRVARACHA